MLLTVGSSCLLGPQDFLEATEHCLQAAVNGRSIARETLKAVRKDVLAKCYGGDVSRKRKLLEKQKEGKKRLRRLGSLQVSSDIFPELLKAGLAAGGS